MLTTTVIGKERTVRSEKFGEQAVVNPDDNDFNYCPYCGRSLEYCYIENEYEE